MLWDGSDFSVDSSKQILKTKEVVEKFVRGLESPSDWLSFCLNKLQFTVVDISGEGALDDAFAFFDSINSKGLRLSDYNLLKAHHLMFIAGDQKLARQQNDAWEESEDDMAMVLGELLRRVRQWSRGEQRDSNVEFPVYKEFSTENGDPADKSEVHRFNNYLQPKAFSGWRRVNGKITFDMLYPQPEAETLFPVSMTQTIEDGDPFFEIAKHCLQQYRRLFSDSPGNSEKLLFVNGLAGAIPNAYLSLCFKAILLYYFDKFGESDIVEVAVLVERILSERRWMGGYVRLEGTMSHIVGLGLVHVIQDSVSSLQVCRAYQRIIQQKLEMRLCDVSEKQKSTRVKRHWDSLHTFYAQNTAWIPAPAYAVNKELIEEAHR